MPIFSYTAQTAAGQIQQNTLSADNETDLATKLQAGGLTLVSATAQSEGNKKSGLSWTDKYTAITLVDKMFFTQNLQVMVRTGFSVSKALKTLSLQARTKRFAYIIEQIKNDVEQGRTLATALRSYPKVFPPIFINMVEAGELSGQLENVLDRLTLQMKKDHNLIAKVKSALTYPVVILVAMVGIAIGMFIFVIPKITSLYAETEVALPMATRILIGVSDFASKNAVFVIGGIIGLVALIIRLIRTVKGKRTIDWLSLKLPIANKIVKKINLARFTRTLSSLLKTDIPIVQTFQIISKTLGNTYYCDAMMQVSEKVKQGITVTSVIENYPTLFPPVVTQIINVGEQSGTLDTIAEEIAVFYEEDVEQTMAGLSTIIEPILMLILGVGVGLIAIAIIMPMYNLTQVI
ncbi:MAG: type II secretion system F family protein [Patescibacteria group bacterium]|jgi:type II secretory pathway component PulF